LRSGVDEEFLDRMRNIEENIERNYKGPINQNELNLNNTNNNDPNNNLNELKDILGNWNNWEILNN